MATASSSMPMPPSHWVRLRQKSMPWGQDSISVNTEEPVVVNPAADSNKASVQFRRPADQ